LFDNYELNYLSNCEESKEQNSYKYFYLLKIMLKAHVRNNMTKSLLLQDFVELMNNFVGLVSRSLGVCLVLPFEN